MLQIQHLSKLFKLDKKEFYALLDVNLNIFQGEILGLVGASGSGKTTLAKILLNLMRPTAGSIIYDHEPIANIPRKKMQMVFQNPHNSLNPKMTVYELISEPMIVHSLCKPEQISARVIELIEMTGLSQTLVHSYTDQLSGGQKQRVAIARTLAAEPEFIIFDEAVSALDASVQAQIVNLLKSLQKRFNLTYLFISHDLAVVKYMTDRVAVMQAGRVVELAPTEEIFSEPKHPYTKELLESLRPAERVQQLSFIPSNFAIDDQNRDKGCPFCDHCPRSEPICWEIKPELKECGTAHFAACHKN
jgi:oligopeptide/dipeptide ABC transporter ATP-binding protein